MKRLLLSAALALVPVLSHAEASQEIISKIVTANILSGFDNLALQTARSD